MGRKRGRKYGRTPVIRRSLPPGTSPGTLAIDPEAPHPRITAFSFGPDDFVEEELGSAADIATLRGARPVLWINIDGLGHRDTLQAVGTEFGLHRLALEDVVNVSQRAKLESYPDLLFLVVRMITRTERIATEQLSLFIAGDSVLTFQEHEGDAFDLVRARIREGYGRIRNAGPDYLAYALIDAVVDAYYPVLEHYGDRIEALEELVLEDPDAKVGTRIHAIKRDLLVIRRALSPHRDALHALLREDSSLVHHETTIYLRDCYDHVVQLLDLVETYRELSSGLLDVHLTTVSNRMNEVMKVLTIFAALFIPLSFIAGLYGMNFSTDSPWNMPELRWAFGYPALLLVMATVATILLLFFRRRGWIGSARRADHEPES